MTLETVTAMALKLCQVHNSKVGQSQQQLLLLLLFLLVQPTEVAFATLKWHGTDRGRLGGEKISSAYVKLTRLGEEKA